METNWEDSIFERKSESDFDDMARTLVGFANSVRPGHVAKLIIGEFHDGTVQGISNVESYQEKVKKKIKLIYPDILYRTRHYKKEGKDVLEIEVEHNGETPHFERPAWIRRANATERANEEVFQKLIDLRLSKVHILSQWLGKSVSVMADEGSIPWGSGSGVNFPMIRSNFSISTLVDINPFWLTVENVNGERRSQPLEKVYLSFDNSNNRLQILTMYSGNAK